MLFLSVRHLRVTGKVEMEEAVPKFTRRASPIWAKNLTGFERVMVRNMRGRMKSGRRRLPEGKCLLYQP